MKTTWGRTLVLSLGLFALAPRAWAQEPAGAAADAAAQPASEVQYGVGVRMPRWVSVPSWLLNAFFQESVPLSTFAFGGVEFIRRKATFDIAVGLAYQGMSPADGNWLARSKDPAVDTDLVQFRDFGLIAFDVSFIGRKSFNPYLGLRYGAGLGLALVRGEMLRTSSAGCTRANVGDERACRPRVCPTTGCTEAALRSTEGTVDGGPDYPARFPEQNVPGALPVINLSLGLDFRLPQVPGLEARLDGGFYNSLFLGLGFAYIFR
jgi:hypothetical protein